jgi:toxin ParE1/3/4
MPYLVRVLPRAESDLDAIYHYIEASTSQAAHKWFSRLSTAIESLSLLPSRCPQTPEEGTTRQLLFGNKSHVYRIIFTVDEIRQQVNILHVRHGARDAFR